MFRFAYKYILLFIFPLLYLFYKKNKEDRESIKLSSIRILGETGRRIYLRSKQIFRGR